MVLGGNLRTGEVKVMIHHLEGGMPENLFQAEDVAPIQQVVGGKGVTAKVSMKPLYARFSRLS